jgi:glycerol-3-phosphate acyltransferase PlsY
MNETLRLLLSGILGYLIGSVSLSIVLSNLLYHRDVRTQGSGNAGATNAARVFGLSAGVLTFLGDFLKTLLALWLGKLLAGENGILAAGALALLGHCFPVYFHFKGGKGVSCGAAIALMIDWRVFLAAVIVFGVMALLFKIASVASLSAAIAVAAGAFVFGTPLPFKILALFTCVLVFAMHSQNIRRLFRGEEKQFHAGSRPPKGK